MMVWPCHVGAGKCAAMAIELKVQGLLITALAVIKRGKPAEGAKSRKAKGMD